MCEENRGLAVCSSRGNGIRVFLGRSGPQTGLNEMEIKALLIKVIIIKIVAAVYRKATKFLVLARNKIS